MGVQTCKLCGKAAECSRKGFACCRGCCRDVLLPLAAEALGVDELRRLLADAGDEAGGDNDDGQDKLARLIQGARPAVRRPLQFSLSDIVNKPVPRTQLQAAAAKARKSAKAAGRPMTSAELSLSLEATRQANAVIAGRVARRVGSRPAPAKQSIVESVRKAGLRA